MFFNTVRESGKKLAHSKRKAKTQDDVVFDVFQKLGDATQHEIWLYLHNKGIDYPTTSICRAVNTLTCLGKIRKTDEMRIGRYGKLIHIWRVR